MLWSCFSRHSAGSLDFLEYSITQHSYKPILEENRLPSIVDTMVQGLILGLPPQSPNVNPTQNSWSYLKYHRRKVQLKIIQEFA